MDINTPLHSPASFSDPISPVTEAFLKAFAANQVLLDCPRMTVRQHATDKPGIFTGRGMLSLLAGEEFLFRMYVDDGCVVDFHPFDELMRMSRRVSGEIIPPDEYYELVATDISGIEWNCGKIEVKFHENGHGTVITGRLLDTLLHRVSDLTASVKPTMSMYFFDNLRIPYTEFISTQSSIGGRTLSSQMRPMLATVDAGNFHFEAWKTEPEKGSTVIRVTSSGDSWPPAIESRVEETLRFVTLRQVHWCIVEKRIGRTREVAVAPRREKESSFFNEPVDHQRPDCAADFWRLFAAYFRHVATHPDAQTYHPLSVQLYRVITTGTRELDILCLLVSIAVEGVLNSEYPDLAKPSEAFGVALDKVATIIRRLKCADGALASRLSGALTPMKSSRPKDKFKVLQERGIVTKDMVKAWDKLRNTTAHASVHFDTASADQLFKRCNTVYTMLNRLVFHAIGYSGKYQNFGKPGWPIEEFGTSPAAAASAS